MAQGDIPPRITQHGFALLGDYFDVVGGQTDAGQSPADVLVLTCVHARARARACVTSVLYVCCVSVFCVLGVCCLTSDSGLI